MSLQKEKKSQKREKCDAKNIKNDNLRLLIVPGNVSFANKKTMERLEMEKCLEVFVLLMEDEKVYMDPFLTFDSICRWIGIGRKDMDRYLEEQFGCDGTDILKAYRGAVPLHFREKYGILL